MIKCSHCIYNPDHSQDALYIEQSGITTNEIAKLDALLHDLKSGHYDDFDELRRPFVSLLSGVRLRALREQAA
jgi:hypothetical protein